MTPTFSFRILSLAASFVLLAHLTACSRKTDARKIDVSVFIVTKGGENIKLGLVEVEAVPFKAAANQLHAVFAKRDEENEKDLQASRKLNAEYEPRAKRLSGELEAARTHEPEAKLNASRALAAFNRAIKDAANAVDAYEDKVMAQTGLSRDDPRFERLSQGLGKQPLADSAVILDTWSEYGDIHSYKEDADKALEIMGREAWGGLPEQRAKVSEAAKNLNIASEAATKAFSDTKRIEKEYNSARKVLNDGAGLDHGSAEEFFNALPAQASSATTDADGRCSLTLPAGKCLVAAHAYRQLPGGGQEKYVWIVEAPGDDHLILSNNNLLGFMGGSLLELLEASK